VKLALRDCDIKHLAIAGGVSANRLLRQEVKALEDEMNIKTYIPKFEFCTDNAAMIGAAGWFKYKRKEFASLDLIPYTRSGL
jgi:N6-L-threonylcarbamoyladenine synthase